MARQYWNIRIGMERVALVVFIIGLLDYMNWYTHMSCASKYAEGYTGLAGDMEL